MTKASLEGKVALVTGASRGLGRAIAKRYGRAGASVIVNYNSSRDAANDVVSDIEAAGGRAIAVRADTSSVEEITALFDQSKEEFDRIDIVVANAGIEIVGVSALDFTEEQFDRIFAVNTKGAFFTLQHAARMIEDNGSILYIGSSTTEFPMPGHAIYGGSKIAPLFLVEVLAKEIGERNVTVNSILPTATEGAGVSTTELRPGAREFIELYNPMNRAGTPEDVADVAEFFASSQAKFVSGQHILLTGGGPA